MDHGYAAHVASNAESGDATEKAENQADAARNSAQMARNANGAGYAPVG